MVQALGLPKLGGSALSSKNIPMSTPAITGQIEQMRQSSVPFPQIQPQPMREPQVDAQHSFNAGPKTPKQLPATGADPQQQSVEQLKKIADYVKTTYPDMSVDDKVAKVKELQIKYELARSDKQITEVKPVGGSIRREASRQPGILPEKLENFTNKANIVGLATEYIDNAAQQIPTITRESMAKALKGTPFEGMEVLPTMVANAPGSLLKTATATARGITNPFDTIVGLGRLALTEEGRQVIADRYGSVEGLKQALTEDPVGMASDALTILQGGTALASKGAKVAGMAEKASRLSSMSQSLGTAADLGLNTLIPKGLGKVSQFGKSMATQGPLGVGVNKFIQGALSPMSPVETVKGMLPKAKTEFTAKDIQKQVMKGFRPTTKSIETAGGQDKYVESAYDATKTIAKNKDTIQLTDAEGNKVFGQTPETILQLDEAIPQAKRKIYENYSSEAKLAGEITTLDTTPIVQELVTLREKMSKMIGTKNTVNYIDSMIKDIQEKGSLEVLDGLDNTQQLNAKLQAFYRNPNPNDVGSNIVDALINNKLKEVIDTTIEGSLKDSKYSEIKKEYTNLKKIERDVKNRSTVEARKNVKGFYDITDIFSAGEAINALTNFSPAGVVKSAGMYAIKEWFKWMNSPDTAVKNIFKKVNKTLETTGEGNTAPSRDLNMKALPEDIQQPSTVIPGQGLPQVKNPTAPTPRTKQVLETGLENVKQPTTVLPGKALKKKK